MPVKKVAFWNSSVPLVRHYPVWNGVIHLIRAATGVDFTPAELEDALDRIYLQEMAFNVRQGMSRVDDRMPQRPEVAGTDAGREDLRRHAGLLDAYYRLHGCDPETGIPTGRELRRLGLADVADVLHGPG